MVKDGRCEKVASALHAMREPIYATHIDVKTPYANHPLHGLTRRVKLRIEFWEVRVILFVLK